MIRLLQIVAFITGLALVGWIAAGYLGSHPVALIVTLMVAAFYLMGVSELWRFQRATAALAQALHGLSTTPAQLGPWLGSLPPGLQNAVRLRIEGERVALPGPTLTPYLAGLLVLLGMLGTFLGMVVTLNGTGLALDNAADLQALRASLSAPVKGLGLAFGTSVAGITASAALGLISALCRRERVLLGQVLDAKVATVLRPFSRIHQRDESFKLLQQQAQSMPVLVDRLQTMMDTLERHSQALGERLAADQQRFHQQAEVAYQALATSVGQSLQASLGESARVAGATIRPAVEAAMAGIAQETAALHDTIARTAQEQLDGLASRFDASTSATAALWQTALQEHREAHAHQSTALRATLDQFAETFAQRSATLVDEVSGRLTDSVGQVSATWQASLALQEHHSQSLVEQTGQAMARAAATIEQHSASLLKTVGESHEQWQARVAAGEQERLQQWTARLESIAATLDQSWQRTSADAVARQLQMADELAQIARDIASRTEAQAHSAITEVQRIAERDDARTVAWSQTLESMASSLKAEWQRTSTDAVARQQQMADELAQIARDIASRTEAQAHSAITEVQRIAERDDARTVAWSQTLESMASSLKAEWQQAGAQTLAQQQQICQTLAQTANEMVAQAESHAKATIAEISRLVQAASEAPRAAAEVVAELRQKLSDSMARDNTMLEERSRILDTLATLLDAVNHASTEQRAAIDALVGSSAELLERVGSRFTEQIDGETGKMAEVAAQITGSAIEVASLGEAFGFAVQMFSQSNDKLLTQLQRIEAALAKSMARSDEQLAYYVAQAREVIDLSIMSQQQIVEDLQQLAGRSAPVVSEA
ncbi:DUF802 domain-containing protein [Ideonella sp. DXS29W]|uniref:DUF802 domain-containing protein n=1 Tax=Ideonella lacteola TaxID=2984193 RepID=A0ABU9BPS6_9BURK